MLNNKFIPVKSSIVTLLVLLFCISTETLQAQPYNIQINTYKEGVDKLLNDKYPWDSPSISRWKKEEHEKHENDFYGRFDVGSAYVKVRFLKSGYFDKSDGLQLSWEDKAQTVFYNAWGQKNKNTKKGLELAFKPRLAQAMWQDLQTAKLSFETTEYGLQIEDDGSGIPSLYPNSSIHGRSRLFPLSTPLDKPITEFAKITYYSGKYFDFEFSRGARKRFTLMRIWPAGNANKHHTAIKKTHAAMLAQNDPEIRNRPKAAFTPGKVQKRYDPARPREAYYLYLPKNIDKTRTYDLVLVFHGDSGTGERYARLLAPLAERGDFIIYAPNWDWSSENPDFEQNSTRSMPANDLAKARNLKKREIESEIDGEAYLRQHFKINTNRYVVGSSSGGGYAFGHAQPREHPDEMAMAVAIDAASYLLNVGTADQLDPNIPLILTCGTKDERYYATKEFFNDTKKLNFKMSESKFIPNQGHGFNQGAADAIIDFFLRVKKGTAR